MLGDQAFKLEKESVEKGEKNPDIYLEFLAKMDDITPQDSDSYLANIKNPKSKEVFEELKAGERMIIVALSRLSEEEYEALLSFLEKPENRNKHLVGLHALGNIIMTFSYYFSEYSIQESDSRHVA